MTSPIIKTNNLSLSIGKSRLLKDVSFSVGKGERVAIVGANGAGKTTLLKCLLGLLKPERGEMEIDGRGMPGYSRLELARKLAYVPQLLEASVPFTVLDFVMMGRYAHEGGMGQGDQEGLRIAMDALQQIGMESFARRTLSTLSGGERQKACIAAALAQQAPVLVLDEPSAHLDPRQREEIHHILCEIGRRQGVTVLAVTHDLNWAAMDYDRMLGMSDGRVVFDGTPAAFMTPENLRLVFGVDFSLHPHPVTGDPIVIPAARKESV
ncbi:ABC transporter ATP-binding protein [Verrucomicrobiaceae bacterium N1E253]|uniref:ABC transporter ATP-binding protein n=1 Tax=Oceaniferula marina TaxID=2748318 RepID=A0A851GM25_9BACT|nr:ABC transporter ATP-binding protein [Oceaniferula marina]NWK56881.1 ABC transporter ATP-binding protein [Oceaniferula marina]